MANRSEFLQYLDKIEDIKAGTKCSTVYLVEISFYNSLVRWIKNKTAKTPLKLDNNQIAHDKDIEYKKDFDIVKKEPWELIQKYFGPTTAIHRYFVINPMTNKPIVLLQSLRFNIILLNNEAKKKTVGPDWDAKHIKMQICQSMSYNIDDVILADAKTNIEITETKKAIEMRKLGDTFVIRKRKMTETLPANSISLSIKSSPLAKTLSSKAADKHIVKPTIEKEKHDFSSSIADKDKYDILPPLKNEIHEPEVPSPVKESRRLTRIASNKSSSSISSKSVSSGNYPKPVGLNNLGNTCFFNAATQCIIRIKPLTDFILSSKFDSQINTSNKKGSRGRIAQAYRDFLIQMSRAASRSSENPSNLRSAVISKYKRFANYSQHDSQEYLNSLLDGLHEDMNQSHGAGGRKPEIKVNGDTNGWDLLLSKNDSPIVDIFYGELFSSTECPSCNYVSSVREPFLFLTVSIPKYSFGSIQLEDLLANFSQADVLDDRNKWKCEKCKNMVKATRRLGILRCAEVLIIHLKRFSGEGYFASKIDTEVKYPSRLDMSKYVRDANAGSYRLVGAVFHSGSLSGGHYTAAALDQLTNTWYNFNDSMASEISESSAHSRSAYILFYQRE